MVRFVVMGAGRASRMGQDKLAMPWRDTTILGHVLRTVICAFNELALQDNQKQDQEDESRKSQSANLRLDHSLKHEIRVIARKPPAAYGINTQPQTNTLAYTLNWIEVQQPQPLATTLRTGIADLPETLKGICFIPGDQVGLEAQALAKMTHYFIENLPDFLIPQSGKITGSPVFFHARYLPELQALCGEQGGKLVLEKFREHWTTYPVDESFFLDIDTKEEYERYKN